MIYLEKQVLQLRKARILSFFVVSIGLNLKMTLFNCPRQSVVFHRNPELFCFRRSDLHLICDQSKISHLINERL